MENRKSPRAIFHDYSGGEYFVTICTRNKEHFFGKIIKGEMLLSPIGIVAQKNLEDLSIHYSYVEIPLFVIMPNHIHAIICIRKPKNDSSSGIPTKRSGLSVVIGGYKQSVTMYARRNNIDFGWQGRYHDHIIRGINDANKITDYINNNIARWDMDCYY